MSRTAYWTIVMEGRPTAFRAGEREALVPTLKQLQNRHPDTHLMWFQNGRYWRTPLDAIRPRPQRRPAHASGGAHRTWRPAGARLNPGATTRRPGPRARGTQKDRRRG